jgi:uncharacterized protein
MLSPEQIEVISRRSASKIDGLRQMLRSYESALIAFSGGVDSTFALKMAADALGPRAVALTAISPSIPREEEKEAAELALRLGVQHLTVRSEELSNPDYARNSSTRCYFCKSELYGLCEQKRAELGLNFILDGLNADDLKDHRPGRRAATEHSVRSPLALAGLTKEEIRAWSHRLGLPTWDKPQMACLASRIPYGMEVTQERLAQIEGAESALRQLGLRTFRVRYHQDIARIEVDVSEYEKFASVDFRRRVNEALKANGFLFATLDLEPFRSGRMNEAAGISPNIDDPSNPASGRR